ncbi:MAG TPA: hypothetical protein VFO55_05430 [Gemmatimonadaceae bacterium]|nr:hypothetical protein [Gemmatimonadaceae bacterium]
MRRITAFVGLAALVGVAFAGSRPPAKGVTYSLRMTTRLPAMMQQMAGPDAAGPVILARVKSVGKRARFDFQAVPQGMEVDGYALMLDSGRVVLVNPAEKMYSEAPAAFGNGGGGGLGMLSAIAGSGRRRAAAEGRNVPQIEITGIVTDLQQLDGDTLQGRQVRHYQMVAEMNIGVMGQMTPVRVEMEMWTADLPFAIVNPFDLGGTVSPDDPAAKFTAKLIEMRKKIQGTPIKTIMTTTVSGLGNGALPPLEFSQTTQITDIRPMEVDLKDLEIPAGFTRRSQD